MAAISQMFSNVFWEMQSFVFFIRISLIFVPKGPINNESALVHVMGIIIFFNQ